MQLQRYVDDIAQQFAVAAAAHGPEAEVVAEQLVPPLRSAMQLALLECLSAAADEITLELAPGSVELRLRGGQPSFAVDGVSNTPPTTMVAAPAVGLGTPQPTPGSGGWDTVADSDGAGSTRINLRLPEALKARVEAAATSEGRSVNAWLVRAAAAALTPIAPVNMAATAHPQRAATTVTGWAR